MILSRDVEIEGRNPLRSRWSTGRLRSAGGLESCQVPDCLSVRLRAYDQRGVVVECRKASHGAAADGGGTGDREHARTARLQFLQTLNRRRPSPRSVRFVHEKGLRVAGRTFARVKDKRRRRRRARVRTTKERANRLGTRYTEDDEDDVWTADASSIVLGLAGSTTARSLVPVIDSVVFDPMISKYRTPLTR